MVMPMTARALLPLIVTAGTPCVVVLRTIAHAVTSRISRIFRLLRDLPAMMISISCSSDNATEMTLGSYKE